MRIRAVFYLCLFILVSDRATAMQCIDKMALGHEHRAQITTELSNVRITDASTPSEGKVMRYRADLVDYPVLMEKVVDLSIRYNLSPESLAQQITRTELFLRRNVFENHVAWDRLSGTINILEMAIELTSSPGDLALHSLDGHLPIKMGVFLSDIKFLFENISLDSLHQRSNPRSNTESVRTFLTVEQLISLVRIKNQYNLSLEQVIDGFNKLKPDQIMTNDSNRRRALIDHLILQMYLQQRELHPQSIR